MTVPSKKQRVLNRIKEIYKDNYIPKSKLLVFRRTLYSKLNVRGINLYDRRNIYQANLNNEDNKKTLLDFVAEDEADILINEFQNTLNDFGIITDKQKKIIQNNSKIINQ